MQRQTKENISYVVMVLSGIMVWACGVATAVTLVLAVVSLTGAFGLDVGFIMPLKALGLLILSYVGLIFGITGVKIYEKS